MSAGEATFTLAPTVLVRLEGDRLDVVTVGQGEKGMQAENVSKL